jgi:hypothetical protein
MHRSHTDKTILLLKIEDRYVPIAEQAVQIISQVLVGSAVRHFHQFAHFDLDKGCRFLIAYGTGTDNVRGKMVLVLIERNSLGEGILPWRQNDKRLELSINIPVVQVRAVKLR